MGPKPLGPPTISDRSPFLPLFLPLFLPPFLSPLSLPFLSPFSPLSPPFLPPFSPLSPPSLFLLLLFTPFPSRFYLFLTLPFFLSLSFPPSSPIFPPASDLDDAFPTLRVWLKRVGFYLVIYLFLCFSIYLFHIYLFIFHLNINDASLIIFSYITSLPLPLSPLPLPPPLPFFPLFLDGHCGWANTATILSSNVPPPGGEDPEGGEVVRDGEGNPTGIFIDTAMNFVDEVVPPPSAKELKVCIFFFFFFFFFLIDCFNWDRYFCSFFLILLLSPSALFPAPSLLLSSLQSDRYHHCHGYLC